MGLLFVGTVPGTFYVFTLFFVFFLTVHLKADRVYVYNSIVYRYCAGAGEVVRAIEIVVT
jgi:hypothetical protein